MKYLRIQGLQPTHLQELFVVLVELVVTEQI